LETNQSKQRKEPQKMIRYMKENIKLWDYDIRDCKSDFEKRQNKS